MARVIGVVLAAGAGARMGRPKAEVRVDGVRLVDRARSALSDGGCAEVVVVARRGMTVCDARVVVNDHPDRGMRSSLELGVEAAAALAADAVVVVLVDTPGIAPAGVRAVLAAWRPGRIAVAAYDGRRGHPTVMAPASWRRAIALAGPDEGARALLRAEVAAVDEIAVDGDPTDLDTAEDLARWNARPARP
ncbi:NTP transferase domain-containing protein [uncultured Jatrophihabitans sp.]|uniref:nucleotidyltransferase family protein n=1 Tax=uncultured Jatrophihabitans sp. TaxID=1610747 RepID=UPI0035CB7C4E